MKSVRFDDPNLVSTAGLVPVMALAQRAGLGALVDEHVSVPGPAGAHAAAKVSAVVAGVDVDDTIRQMHGYAQQGVAYWYSKFKGLNAQLAVLSTRWPGHRRGPVAKGQRRLRPRGTQADRRRGGHRPPLRGRAAGHGPRGLRALPAQGGRHGPRRRARFSITARTNPQITKAIANINPDAWTAIKYPQAIFDTQAGGWISDAAVAEVAFTAFTSRPKAEQVTARLIVRRVKRLKPAAGAGQSELFDTFRYHAVFTDSAETMLHAEAHHRDHAIVEQVIADLKNGPLAHLPSGVFTANAAWTTLATIAFNLTRAAATLAGPADARATTATIRRRLIHVAARLVTTARRLHLHLPATWPWPWPWAAAFTNLFEATCGPPPAPST